MVKKFSEHKTGFGILKEDADGLFVESNETYNFHFLTSNNLSGGRRREWHKIIKKKSIFKIRGGLSF